MKSLDTLLAEAVGKMRPATLKKYNERTNGKQLAQEQLVNIAESLVAQEGELSVRESRPIRRNNGAAQAFQESSDPYEKGDAILFEAMRSRGLMPKETVELKEASELTGAQRKEYEFGRLIGLIEADALKSAKASF